MSAAGQLRRLALRKCAEDLAAEYSFKTAQQVGIRFGDTALGPRRLDSFPQVRAAGGNVLDAIAAYRKSRPNPFVPKALQAQELKARAANAQRPPLPDLHALQPAGVVPAAFARPSAGQRLLRRLRPAK